MKTSLLKTIKSSLLLLTVILTAISCDKDFVNVESDIRGVQNFNTSRQVFPFKAYNKAIVAPQTNNLPNYLLGVYNDPNYGATAASVVAQIVPTDLAPDFGLNPEIESVKLYIPFYSTPTATDVDGDSTYELDSIFGDAEQTFTLSVYKNKFYLRDLDPETNFEDPQAYYSNSYNALNANDFEDQLLYSNPNFKPSANEYIISEDGGETVSERKTPGIYIDLDNLTSSPDNSAEVPVDFWKNLILDNQGQDVLTNSESFKDFFRGLIIKTESLLNEGSMVMLNLNNAVVEIKYESDVVNSDPLETELSTYTLDLNGINFNRFDNSPSFPILTDGDETNGDDQLFLKGFEGSMTVIELFNGTVLNDDNLQQDALEYFKNREEKWLINEANLTFYVDDSAVSDPITDEPSPEPDRIILYDLTNNIPILDYFADITEDLSNPINSKIIHAPKLIREANGKGIKYKFRITQHLNRMLINDVENVKLGLYVFNNVNLTATSELENADEDDTVTFSPQNSVIAPKGTILHGNTSSVPDNVKATFEIFYTESQN